MSLVDPVDERTRYGRCNQCGRLLYRSGRKLFCRGCDLPASYCPCAKTQTGDRA